MYGLSTRYIVPRWGMGYVCIALFESNEELRPNILRGIFDDRMFYVWERHRLILEANNSV